MSFKQKSCDILPTENRVEYAQLKETVTQKLPPSHVENCRPIGMPRIQYNNEK